ncbi:hypothetical protein [Flavobacterium sp. XS2P14]|uniref:hypothetical protein n=1 Tax=unclassified Flavobacterium TaxID=196869 RepID=UPI003AACE120
MKLKSLFIFLVWSGSIYSQEFIYDIFLQYKNISSGNIHFYMVNSLKNTNLFTGHSKDFEMYGSIFEEKKQTYHKFKVHNLEKSVSFIYEESKKQEKFNAKRVPKFYYKQIETLIDSIKTKVLILGYARPKMKRAQIAIEIIYENSDVKFNEEFLNSFSHGSFLNTDFKISIGIPIKIIVDYKNGNIRTYERITKKTIATKLIIPKI